MSQLTYNPALNHFEILAAKAPYPFLPDKNGVWYFDARYPMSEIGSKNCEEISEQARQKIKELSQLTRLDTEFFKVQPYAHQIDAIQAMLRSPRLALLLEQGLGKTYISIMAIDYLKRLGMPHKTIVVCPAIVYFSWQEEIRKYSDLRCVVYRGSPKEREAQRRTILCADWDILLTTFEMLTDKVKPPKNVYEIFWKSLTESQQADLIKTLQFFGKNIDLSNITESLQRVPEKLFPQSLWQQAKSQSSNNEFFTNLPFDNLVVDEASRCLDHQSKRSLAIFNLSRKAKRTYLLSGTLCVGRPSDMFMPMTILSKDILAMSHTNFCRKFINYSQYNSHIPIGYKNLDKLKTLIDPHIIARTRAECIDLPERIFQTRYYEPSPNIKRLYNSLIQNGSCPINGVEIKAPDILQKIQKTMQMLCGFVYYYQDDFPCDSCEKLIECLTTGKPDSCDAKFPKRKTLFLDGNPKLNLLLEDLADCRDEKVIVWAWHKQDLEEINKAFTKAGIKFISASTPMAPQIFESDKTIKVFLGQTMQGIGITLNSATCMIYYSHGMALEPRLQSMDRNYRLGQTKTVIVKDYICRNSIEEKIVSLLNHKADVRDFMQSRADCLFCHKFAQCRRNCIKLFQKGCELYNAKEKAQKVVKLKLQSI